MHLPYPPGAAARDAWILQQRPGRELLDPLRPYDFFVEKERAASGELVDVATVFLTNRECPWRCAMCDLWRNTLTDSVPAGAIPAQIDYALARLGPARAVKLYNSGSFFDAGAIPVGDYAAIAERVAGFATVTVESHPALVGDRCLRFRDLLAGRLEVAMGLETAHPEVLEKLNKRMTLDQYAAAAGFLKANGIALRAFVLVQPPFMKAEESLEWAKRSVDFAFDCGAGAVSLIPTRGGNGAMETLQAQGEFAPPGLEVLEAAQIYGLRLGRGRVFSDLWGVAAGACGCAAARIAGLREMNLSQCVVAAAACAVCGSAG